MKISIIILLGFIIQVGLSAKGRPVRKPRLPSLSSYPKTKLGSTARPRSFHSEIKGLLSKMAKENGYTEYDKCHIIPWQFMKDMVVKHWQHRITNKTMHTFILNLADSHSTAAFYKALSDDTQKALTKSANKYKKCALDALNRGDSTDLLKCLFNMPSNLYPGDPSNNRSIKDNLDPPKEANKRSGARTGKASRKAEALYQLYTSLGLTTKDEVNGNDIRIKTADKPPGDHTGDFITIV